jgi:hypothetical protein
MLCARRRPAIAVSPSALRAGWLRERVCADPIWSHADIFLVDTLFAGEAQCPSEASALLCCESLRPAQLHFGVADERDAVRAASAYEQELRAFFNLRAGELPRFDLVVTGNDTRRPAADELSRIAVARYSPVARRSYVTLTEPVLRLAAQRIQLATTA